MAGPARWPGERSLWIAPLDPARPAEVTMPLPVARCADCADRDRHEWRRVEVERVDERVSLRRYRCQCDRCGRCDARLVNVHIER